MKKALLLMVVVIGIIFISSLFSQEFTFVGAAKCKMCHKTEKQGQQHPLWEARKHSKSFQALTSDQAKEIAQQAGVENPVDNPKCLSCHGPLFEKAPELKEEGVTCENCHGPGSEYKKMSIMKDHAESVKNGMKEYGSPEAIKKQCLSCHENAHEKAFDFEAAWEKVKHPRPKE
jgi:DnaJ-class molecular chaperone